MRVVRGKEGPMSAEDHLRLAWQVAREGRPESRDALLTLAVAEAAAAGLPWAGRVRDRLVADRPHHPFAAGPTLDRALADPRVAAALARPRRTFPPARVRWLAERADAGRGPYTGRAASIEAILDDLLAPPPPPRRRRATPLGAASVAAAEHGPRPARGRAGPTFDVPATAD